jgi:hypothetical protein
MAFLSQSKELTAEYINSGLIPTTKFLTLFHSASLLQNVIVFFFGGPISFADVSCNLFSTSNGPGYLAHQGPWLPLPP